MFRTGTKCQTQFRVAMSIKFFFQAPQSHLAGQWELVAFKNTFLIK